jgi:hypothetical protein
MRLRDRPNNQRASRASSVGRVQKRRTAAATPKGRTQGGTSRLKGATSTKQQATQFLQRSQSEVEADPNRKTHILRLPKELVSEIASYLPVESAVCFTLTCKEALDILGNSSWEAPAIKKRWFVEPTTHREHRPLFIELLYRDLEGLDFTLCFRCNSIHPPFKPPRTHQETKLTKSCLGQGGVIDYLPHYSLVFEHIQQALKLSEFSVAPKVSGPQIDLLAGNHTTDESLCSYTLLSSARRFDRSLILRHDHIIRSNASDLASPKRGKSAKARNTSLLASTVISLPLRLCPHQTTSLASPPPTRWTSFSSRNSPLLTHAIASAFPADLRGALPHSSVFRDLTPLEQEQVAAADAGEEVVWRCRGCPTKFRAVYKGEAEGGGKGGEVVVTAWHSFGKDEAAASNYWKMFVRREGESLGKGKRNSEFYTLSKSVPDFRVE